MEGERGQIEVHFRLRGDEMKSADAVQLDQRVEREDELRPAAPLPGPQREFLTTLGDLDRVAIARDRDSHRSRAVRRISKEHDRRALNVRVDQAFVVFELYDIAHKLIIGSAAVDV